VEGDPVPEITKIIIAAVLGCWAGIGFMVVVLGRRRR
jgi:hypothetical protein